MNSDSMTKTFLITNAISSGHVRKERQNYLIERSFHIIFNLIPELLPRFHSFPITKLMKSVYIPIIHPYLLSAVSESGLATYSFLFFSRHTRIKTDPVKQTALLKKTYDLRCSALKNQIYNLTLQSKSSHERRGECETKKKA